LGKKRTKSSTPIIRKRKSLLLGTLTKGGGKASHPSRLPGKKGEKRVPKLSIPRQGRTCKKKLTTRAPTPRGEERENRLDGNRLKEKRKDHLVRLRWERAGLVPG